MSDNEQLEKSVKSMGMANEEEERQVSQHDNASRNNHPLKDDRSLESIQKSNIERMELESNQGKANYKTAMRDPGDQQSNEGRKKHNQTMNGMQNNMSRTLISNNSNGLSKSAHRFNGSTAGEHAKMLMTGMSAIYAQNTTIPATEMTQAKNNLKLVTHQQTQLQARLIKLTKEEERAQKRIRDANRRAEFLSEMNRVKEEKMNMKYQFQKEMQEREENNRSRINHHRSLTKFNINNNKLRVLDTNRDQRMQIKEQQQKIKETIQQNKLKNIQDRQNAAMELYNMKKKAKFTRNQNEQSFNSSTIQEYKKRILQTNMEAQMIDVLTKKLEEQEAAMLAKLQNTYTQEKIVIQKLNEMASRSPSVKGANGIDSEATGHKKPKQEGSVSAKQQHQTIN